MSVFVNTYTSIQYRMVNTDFSNAASAALFSEVCDAADETIRTCLSKQYDVSAAYFQTSTSAPPMLQEVGENLVIGYMIESLSRGGEAEMKRADRYLERAMAVLNDLKDNKIALFDSLGSIITPDSSDYPGVLESHSSYEPTFNEDHPLDWSQDDDKLEDIFDARDT